MGCERDAEDDGEDCNEDVHEVAGEFEEGERVADGRVSVPADRVTRLPLDLKGCACCWAPSLEHQQGKARLGERLVGFSPANVHLQLRLRERFDASVDESQHSLPTGGLSDFLVIVISTWALPPQLSRSGGREHVVLVHGPCARGGLVVVSVSSGSGKDLWGRTYFTTPGLGKRATSGLPHDP